MRRFHLLFAVGVVLVALAACGGAGPGDPERGRQIYAGEVAIGNGDVPVCIDCHPVNPGETAEIMGQNLSNIGSRAGAAVAGQSADEYLFTAIVDPDAHLSGDFQEGIMYRYYRRDLSAQQINDLIAYMLTLRGGAGQ